MSMLQIHSFTINIFNGTPVLHALQGHPEADVLWKVHAVNNKQGSSSVMNLNLLPTAHGQTMYRTTFGD
jgi:hypothetical protein